MTQYRVVAGVATERMVLTVPVELHGDLLKLFPDDDPLFASMSDLFCSALRWYIGAVYDQIIVEQYQDWMDDGQQRPITEYVIYKDREIKGTEYDCFENLVDLYKEQTSSYKPDSSRLQMTIPVGLLRRSEMLYELCRFRIQSIDCQLFRKMNRTRYYTIILAAYLREINDCWREIIDLDFSDNTIENK